MTDTDHAAPRQDRPPIEELDEIGQDALFDAMLHAYCDPPADVRDRLAGIAARTRAVLDGGYSPPLQRGSGHSSDRS